MNKLITASSLDKVFPNSKPSLLQNEYSIFKNEVFHFQVCCRPDYPLFNCRIGVESPIADYITVRRVEPMPAHLATKRGECDNYIIKKKDESTLYPDLLRDMRQEGEILRQSLWTSFWITVNKDGQELTPGVYDITIKLYQDRTNLYASCDFKLTVLDASLPKSDLKYTAWIHYDCIAYQHSVEMFSPEYYQIFNEYLKSALRHGMTMLYTPLFTPPLDTEVGHERQTAQLVEVTCQDGGYSFNFDKLAYFIDNARKLGVQQFEFSHLATQWGGYKCPKIIAQKDGKPEKIFGWHTESSSPEYLSFLDSFLGALAEFVDKMGIQDMVYFHISDEPGNDQLEQFRKIKSVLIKHFENARIMDALSHGAYYYENIINTPVVSTDCVDNFKFREGTERWVYYCGWQRQNYLSNRFFNMPSQRNRILGMQLYLNGIKGFLHWGFNFYNSVFSKHAINPYFITDADGNFESGDSFIVYPKAGGVYESLRHEVFYDGLNDYRALKLLESFWGRERVIKLLKKQGMKGFTRYKRCAKWHLKFRQKINQAVMKELQAKNS